MGFAPTPDGKGYWLVASRGEVYAFGDAGYYGSLGATNLHNIPIVAIAPSYDGRGYWIVQGGGEVIPYGDAPRLGEMGRGHPPVDGIAVTPDGEGYWLVCGNGEVDAFGDAPDLGGNNTAVPRPPISEIVADPAGAGYWLLDSEAFPVSLDHPDAASQAIVDIAASQLGPSKDGGNYCNPYGPVRGVVRVVRHLGMGESRYPDPAVRLCGQCLRLGAKAHLGYPGYGEAGRR